VQNGRFRCSRYDSDQADQLSPGNESELTLQQQEVARRRNALDSLTTQINLSNVNQYSGKAAIDIYNALVEQYNAQLTSFKSDVVAYQARVDRFNAQVVVHNNYLLEHCRSGR
jgi:peptidoglycan hydrolase CwlO-like protein